MRFEGYQDRRVSMRCSRPGPASSRRQRTRPLDRSMTDGELLRRQQWRSARSCTWGSRSTSTATAPAPNASSRLISSPDRGGSRMELGRAGVSSSDPRAEPVHRRYLSRSEDRQGRSSLPKSSTPRAASETVHWPHPPDGVWCHQRDRSRSRIVTDRSTSWRTTCVVLQACRTSCRTAS